MRYKIDVKIRAVLWSNLDPDPVQCYQFYGKEKNLKLFEKKNFSENIYLGIFLILKEKIALMANHNTDLETQLTKNSKKLVYLFNYFYHFFKN